MPGLPPAIFNCKKSICIMLFVRKTKNKNSVKYGGREGSGNLRFIWENLRFVRENLRFVRENLRFVRENLRFVKGESSFCAEAFVYHYEIDLTLFMVLDTNNIYYIIALIIQSLSLSNICNGGFTY